MTTTTGSTEEHPFIAAMERKTDDVQREMDGASLIKGIFQADGFTERFSTLLERLKAKITLVEAKADEALKAEGYEDPEEDAPPVPPGIAISGGGNYRPKSDWPRRRNSIIDGLLIAGIIALVSTSIYLLKTTVQLETSYTERGTLYDERFRNIAGTIDRQDTELRRHDERLDRLEQQRRDAQPHADNQ
jgi:hypothetical protein